MSGPGGVPEAAGAAAHGGSAVRAFRVLAGEALADAVRRRAVAAIAVVSVLSLLGIDSCTSCSGASVVVNGEPTRLPQVAGATGLFTFTVLSLWCMALAGVLAADHLVQTLDDGSASLCLARPIGRATFAWARLAGALAIALATGLLLLGATASLLQARSGLPVAPALLAGLAFALGATTLSALAMTASLFLPRIANVLLVFLAVGSVALANALALAGRAPDGLLGWLDRLGPPLASAVGLSLAAWIPDVELAGERATVAARSLVWAVLAPALLRWAFARVEIGGAAP